MKEGTFNRAREIIQRNTRRRIQRFYRKRINEKDEINDRKERIQIDVKMLTI